MKSKKLKTVFKYVCVAVIAAIVTFFSTLVYFGGSEFLLRYLIKTYYVEDVEQSVINEGAKAGIVSALGDEHSVYISSEYGFDYFENSISGEYSGIGAAIQQINKKAVIMEVYDDSPAKNAGLKKGDIILEVDGILSKGSTLTEISQRLLGKSGTSVNVKIDRGGSEIEFDIVRAAVSIHTVSYKTLENDIGYIKMTTFDSDSDKEFINALLNLKDCKKLIIDLRDNPGGYMDVAVNTIDLFINDSMITTAKYKAGEKDYFATSTNETGLSDEFLLKTPVCVLVNQNSASASEIFSAALKDHKRATIVGVNTFGKGSIQSTFPFNDNSGIKLTIGHFYSPNGTKIDKAGVKPDIEVKLPEKYNDVAAYDIPENEDLQLKAAINALNQI